MVTTRVPATRRADYRVLRPATTRWRDNDVFGHVNNAAYYAFFDTAVTAWMLEHGLLGMTSGPMWLVVETGCRFLGEVSFPDPVTVGLRLGRLGTSSVRWELALFRAAAEDASAESVFVHVHVDRATRRPAPVPDAVRALIEAELGPASH